MNRVLLTERWAARFAVTAARRGVELHLGVLAMKLIGNVAYDLRIQMPSGSWLTVEMNYCGGSLVDANGHYVAGGVWAHSTSSGRAPRDRITWYAANAGFAGYPDAKRLPLFHIVPGSGRTPREELDMGNRKYVYDDMGRRQTPEDVYSKALEEFEQYAREMAGDFFGQSRLPGSPKPTAAELKDLTADYMHGNREKGPHYCRLSRADQDRVIKQAQVPEAGL